MNQNSNKHANSSDFRAVAVCFLDPDVTAIFAALLEARGIPARILESICDFNGDTKIITEPIYFPLIDRDKQDKCLVVGHKEALSKVTAQTLCQPLTEDKIELALINFLGAN